MRNSFLVLALVFLCVPALAAASQDNSAPHLETRNGVRQLIVDGKPFLILGGELHNSSSSSLAYMKNLWPILVEKKLNTVLAAVSWELIEPQEGKFDFTLVDALVQDARKNHMRLVFLWFGSWKNGVSSYVPYWVKTDPKRFPLAVDKSGKTLNILSTFAAATRDADAKAFAALMRHIHEIDGKEHTVLMMQVENEVGVLGDSRDNSPPANSAFAGEVPKELMDYLQQHKETLAPELSNVWKTNGQKSSGTWALVFGEGKTDAAQPPNAGRGGAAPGGWAWASDNIFMAWHYAQYINHVTEKGKAEYDIPMYANAWLPGANSRPGDYPSGGPLAQVADIWRAGAPRIDFQSPDLYSSSFDEFCDSFTRNGNPLFIPETGAGARGASNALNALIKRNGIGFSPFGIEGFGFAPRDASAAPSADPLAQTYAILDFLSPEILSVQGKNKIVFIEGVDATSPPQTIKLGDYTLTLTFSVPAGRGSRGPAPTTQPTNASPARFVINSAPGEYIFVGGPMNAAFTSNTPGSGTTLLGSFDESMSIDGRWVPGRRLNGDETTHNTRWPAMTTFGIYRYRVYQRD